MNKIEHTIPKELEYAEKLVGLMDDKFKIPFINFRFGLDPIIGLIPVAGDIVSFSVSSLIVIALFRNGVPRTVVLKMAANIVLDLIIGGIPVIGDAWDFFNKANRKNLKLARKHFLFNKVI